MVQQGDWQQCSEQLGAEVSEVQACLMPDLYSTHRVSFIDAEKKLLTKTVPYSLEDDLAEDISDLHFALGNSADGQVDVAVIRRQTLQAIMDKAAAHNIELQTIQTCPQVEEPSLVLLGDGDLMVSSGGTASVVATHSLTAVLASLNADNCRVQRLHSGVKASDDIVVSGGPSFYDQLVSSPNNTIDFRQGEFRRGIAWANYWQAWKAPAIAAGVLMAMLIGQAYWQMGLLEQRNLEYRQAIEKVYRDAFPNSRIVNPRQQMQTKLQALQGQSGGQGSNMVALLAALQSSPIGAQLEISGISYEARAAELRLDVLASNFQQVESLRADLRAKGIKADLQNSSAAGNKVRAKLALSEV